MSVVYEEDLVRAENGDLLDKDGNVLEHNGVWLARNVSVVSRDQTKMLVEHQVEGTKAATRKEEAILNRKTIVDDFLNGVSAVKKLLSKKRPNAKSSIEKTQHTH